MIICNIDSRMKNKQPIPQRILDLREASRKARTHAEKMSFSLSESAKKLKGSAEGSSGCEATSC